MTSTQWVVFGILATLLVLCLFPLGWLLYHIQHNMSILDDAIGLNKELRVISYTIMFGVALLLLDIGWQIILSTSPERRASVQSAMTMYSSIFIFSALRVLFVIMNWRHTRWVVDKFGHFA